MQSVLECHFFTSRRRLCVRATSEKTPTSCFGIYSNFKFGPKRFVFIFSGFDFYSFLLVSIDDEMPSHLHCSEVCSAAENYVTRESIVVAKHSNSDDAALSIFSNRLFLMKMDCATRKRFSGREQLIMGIGHRESHREVDGNRVYEQTT